MAAASSPGDPPAGALPPFQFRRRHESPDWRRLSTVDVERVAAELDVAALQDHLGHVAFCTAERERCPRCQAPADPLLLKLLRLAQLCLEYLLHSQDYLSAQLRAAQELLRAADAHRQQLAKEVARGAQEVRLLKEECKRRKKMLGTQQMMLQAGATCHQCQFCDKAFMNYSFLHSHLQRRHMKETYIGDQEKNPSTDKLQEEINNLKEQLQLTRSQLETEQHAYIVKLSKEYEKHRSKEEEIRQLFHEWKEEEKEKLVTELEKIKEMFMKEFKELSAKNTELENHLLEVQKSNKHLKSNLGTLKDSYEFVKEKHRNAVDQQKVMLLEREETKWTSKEKALQEKHENEKRQLTSQIEKLKTSMSEELNTNRKKIEELEQRLKEQENVIITQKYQGVRGIPSDHLTRVLMSVESAREERKKLVPNIQHIREQLKQQVSSKVAERASCSRLLSSSHLSPVHQKRVQVGGSLSTVLSRPVKRFSIAKRQSKPRAISVENTSSPKSMGDEIPRNSPSVTTPPFSPEEEMEEDGILQSYISPELSQPKASKNNSKGTLLRFASQSDVSSSEEEGTEEIKVNPQPSKNCLTQRGTEQVEKLPLSQGNESKHHEGITIGPEPTQKCTPHGIKFTDTEDEDYWDLAHLEDEKPLPAKDEKMKNVTPVEKNISDTASMVHAWGAPVGKAKKDEGPQDANKSTFKSNLVTVTDWSDISDI